VLYIGRGDKVRGRGRKSGGRFSIPAVLKPKRRGRGDVRVPLDEGNGGGIGSASLPLPPSTGGHPLVGHGVAAPAGAVVAQALSDEGDDPELTDRVGPPVSEREATAESDKQREGGDDRIRQAEQAGLTDRVDPPVNEREATAKSDKRSRPDREGGGGPRLG
jgi:hypothetical protein